MIEDLKVESFDIINFILSSKLRVDLMYFLYKKDRKIDELASLIDKKPSNISRALKELFDKGIVEKSGKSYLLTSTGRLMAIVLYSLYNSFIAIDEKEYFWKTHSIKLFTAPILSNISCLECGEIISSDNINFNKAISFYLENIKKSKNFKIMLPIFSSLYLNAFFDALDRNNATMEVILDNAILNFILESEFSVTFNNYVKENKIKLFIVDMKIDMFFTLCDDFFALFLFSDDGYFDESSIFFVENEKCLRVLNETFNQLKKLSQS